MFDVFVILYVLVDLFLGFRYGTFRRIIHIGAFFLGLLLAQALSVGFAQLLNFNTSSNPISLHYLLFMGIVFALVVLAEVLGFAYASALTFLNAMIFDRFIGLVLGLVSGVVEMSIVLFIFTQMYAATGPSGTSQLPALRFVNDQIGISFLAPQLEKLESVTRVLYTPVLPPQFGTYFTKTYS